MIDESKIYIPIERFIAGPASMCIDEYEDEPVDLTGAQVRIVLRSMKGAVEICCADVYRDGLHIGAIEQTYRGATFYAEAAAADFAELYA